MVKSAIGAPPVVRNLAQTPAQTSERCTRFHPWAPIGCGGDAAFPAVEPGPDDRRERPSPQDPPGPPVPDAASGFRLPVIRVPVSGPDRPR
ncbi:hypothetical protein GCM10010430_19700 [Kitasatospora cystarginea]|uniref:Uncharacterized protein n=1 Tax=Kitasatospora cystarginea TaxID=58350 RepID=A0ABN3DQQ1_9ACTN